MSGVRCQVSGVRCQVLIHPHLYEIKDICIICVEQANVVVASKLDGEVEAPLVLPPLLTTVPQP